VEIRRPLLVEAKRSEKVKSILKKKSIKKPGIAANANGSTK